MTTMIQFDPARKISNIETTQVGGRFSILKSLTLGVTKIKTSTMSFYNSMPKIKIDSPSNIMRKIHQMALPAILLAGFSGVQGASAIGCLGCVICLAGGGGPFCVPICVVCGVTIPIPLA